MARTLLDTDILSLMMRRDPRVTARAEAYLQTHGHLTLCVIGRYEILKGLKAKGASVQTAAFETFCSGAEIVDLDAASVNAAADIFAELKRAGRLISDADILVAGMARSRGLTLATHNVRHFDPISGLTIDDWAYEADDSGRSGKTEA